MCLLKNVIPKTHTFTTQISSICPHHVETQHERRRPVSQAMVRPWGLRKSDFLDTPHSTVAAIGPSTLPYTHPALCGILYLEFQIPHPVLCILNSVFCVPNLYSCVSQHTTNLRGYKVYHNTLPPGHYYCWPRPNSNKQPLRVDLAAEKETSS